MRFSRSNPAARFSANNTAGGSSQEVDQEANLRTGFELLFELVFRLAQREPGLVERLVGALETGNGFRLEAAPPKSLGVDPVWLGGIARRRHVRRNILQHNCADRGDAVGADATELVDGGETSEYRVVADMHVAGKLGIVCENRVVADLAVVRKMNVSHDPIVVTDPRHAGVLYRPAVEGTKLANGVVIPDFEAGCLAIIFLVLRHFTQGHELIDPVMGPNARVSRNDRVRPNTATGPDFDLFTNDGIRPDLDVGGDFRAWIDDRRRMDSSFGVGIHLSNSGTDPLNLSPP